MHLAGKRILVVDDDAAIADFLRDAFSSNGASVRIAASVKDGLAALRASEFHLILLDYVISEKVAEQFLAKATMLGSGTYGLRDRLLSFSVFMVGRAKFAPHS